MQTSNQPAFLFALVTIVMQVASQLLLRSQVVGMQNLPFSEVVMKSLVNPMVWLALSTLVVGVAAWLFTLSRLDLNQAYPLVALTIPLTAVLSTWIFSEPLPLVRSLGIGLIIVGVLIVGRS